MARLFDVLEQPVHGSDDWYLRKLKQHQPVGTDVFVWRVELARRSNGVEIVHECDELMTAWARAVEAARGSDMKLWENDEPAAEPEAPAVDHHQV